MAGAAQGGAARARRSVNAPRLRKSRHAVSRGHRRGLWPTTVETRASTNGQLELGNGQQVGNASRRASSTGGVTGVGGLVVTLPSAFPRPTRGGSGGMMGRCGGMGDSTMADMSLYGDLFSPHPQLRRTVLEIPDGVRTTTESDHPQINSPQFSLTGPASSPDFSSWRNRRSALPGDHLARGDARPHHQRRREHEINRLSWLLGFMGHSNFDQGPMATPPPSDRATDRPFGARIARAARRWAERASHDHNIAGASGDAGRASQPIGR